MELKKVNYISDEELTSYKKELFNSIINDSSFYKEVLLSSFTNEDIMSNLSLFDTVNYYGGENKINNGNSFNYLGQKSFTIPDGIIEDFELEENTDFHLTTFSEENYRYFILAKSRTIRQNDYWYIFDDSMFFGSVYSYFFVDKIKERI